MLQSSIPLWYNTSEFCLGREAKNMSTEELIRNLKNLKIIAHRLGYQMTEYPENSLDSLKTIFANSDLLECCDGFEFDICFTKDHIPVVLHDKYIDDVSEKSGFVSDYTLDELRRINFGFRKSKGLNNSQFSYRIITLDELLNFFLSHYDVVKDREIKIETKDYRFISRQNFSIKNFVVLADLVHKYHMLNITHLSF